jgi:hypothetical protein
MYKPNQTNGSFQTSESLSQPTTNNLEGWEEEFDEKFGVEETTEYYQELARRIKQFISDLRKKDEEELIERLPDKYPAEEGQDTSEVGFNTAVNYIKKLIKNYYNLIK